MKIGELFPRKSPVPRKDRGGLTPERAAFIEKEFSVLIEPLDQKATQFFRSFTVNGKYRFWLLPSCETWRDLSFEKMQHVLAYGQWYVSEISKVELDSISYEFSTSTNNEAQKHIGEQTAGMGAADCSGSCSR